MPAKLRAYAQLLRLPNVFTAMADPLAGWFLVGGGSPAWNVALLMAASACLYTSGIVFNDCFDYRLDCRERPERPLPRGAIALATAWSLAVILMATGLLLAGLVGKVALGIAGFIAVMIFFYNAWAKCDAILGPLALGTCRFANFLLGMRCCPPRLWIAPAILGIYVATLTFIARNEVVNPAIRRTVKRMLLGIIVLDAVLSGNPLVLVLLVPAFILSKLFAMT